MMFRMIIWNEERFAALRAATDEALRLDTTEFVCDLDKKLKNVRINTEQAVAAIAEYTPIFAQAARVYPENKEGPEP